MTLSTDVPSWGPWTRAKSRRPCQARYDRHVAQDFLGFIRGLKKYRPIVENVSVRATKGADFISVFYLIL